MLSTLRRRFVLSHMLPLMLIVPLMGIALIYILETQVLLSELGRGLQEQAELVAEISGERSDIWQDPVQAQAFVTRLDARLESTAMLVGLDGYLLASNDPDLDSIIQAELEPLAQRLNRTLQQR